ncbi:energy transducer TonB [Sunxiuqinia dokdonensis]|nr:hypothetical protein [Sunxiuqinia dokdonensis]
MKIRTLLILMILLFGLGNTSRADKIIHNGVTYELYGYPLQFNSRFTGWKIKPIFGEDANDKVFAAFDAVPYNCTWIVQNNHLYLQSIRGKNAAVDLQAIFSENFDNGLVLADWIDTILYAPYGKMLCSWGVSLFESTFEYELAFKISKGEVLSVEKCDNTKTKPLKDDRHLQVLIQNNINWENLPKSDSIKRKVYVQVLSADSLGKIDSVRIVKGVNTSYDREAIRVVKSIPDWPVIYRHGKVFSLWTHPINFGKRDKN